MEINIHCKNIYCIYKRSSDPVTGQVVAQRLGTGIALLFQDHGTRKGCVLSSMHRPYFTPGKEPAPNIQEAGCAPVSVLARCGKSRPPSGFDPRTVHPVTSRYTD